MISYFSATGNSEYVARRIAAETGDIAVSITDCYKKQIFSFDEKCKTLGIVSPTYSWGLPVIVIEFLQRLDLSHKPAIYFLLQPMEQPRDKLGDLQIIFLLLKVCHCPQNSA